MKRGLSKLLRIAIREAETLALLFGLYNGDLPVVQFRWVVSVFVAEKMIFVGRQFRFVVVLASLGRLELGFRPDQIHVLRLSAGAELASISPSQGLATSYTLRGCSGSIYRRARSNSVENFACRRQMLVRRLLIPAIFLSLLMWKFSKPSRSETTTRKVKSQSPVIR